MMPTLSQSQLAMISRRTLGHYDKHAEDLWQGTRDHDVPQNMNALLDASTAEPP